MQTFVPYPNIHKSVSCLDRRRLGKQRLESWQILNCLCGISSLRWRHHPAVKMWKGSEEFLKMYMNACIIEWIRRGYKNTMKIIQGYGSPPRWWGADIHSSHRAALLFKDISWYNQFGWTEKPEIKYVWPSRS